MPPLQELIVNRYLPGERQSAWSVKRCRYTAVHGRFVFSGAKTAAASRRRGLGQQCQLRVFLSLVGRVNLAYICCPSVRPSVRRVKRRRPVPSFVSLASRAAPANNWSWETGRVPPGLDFGAVVGRWTLQSKNGNGVSEVRCCCSCCCCCCCRCVGSLGVRWWSEWREQEAHWSRCSPAHHLDVDANVVSSFQFPPVPRPPRGNRDRSFVTPRYRLSLNSTKAVSSYSIIVASSWHLREDVGRVGEDVTRMLWGCYGEIGPAKFQLYSPCCSKQLILSRYRAVVLFAQEFPV